jgi:hypothetical protein
MTFNMGTGAKVAIGKESVWGIPVADTMLLNFTSEGVAVDAKKSDEESLLATKAKSALDLTSLAVGGDVSMVLKPENAGFLIKAALGGTDTVVAVTGQQQHTIIAQTASSALPSYTVFVDRKQAIKKYSGMKVDSLKLSAKAGDYCKATVSFKGKDEATGTITSTTAPSLKAYKFIGGTFTLGGQALDITSFEFQYDNNLDSGIQTNTSGVYFTEPIHGTRKIGFSIDMPYETNSETIRNTNYLTETLLGTAVFHIESPSIIATTYKYRMDITLNNVAITGAKVNVGGSGIISITLSGEATSVGATEPVSVVVYDATASAY